MSNPNKEMTLTEKNTEVSMLLDCYCESIVLGCNDADKYKAEAEAFNPTLAKFWFTKTRIKEQKILTDGHLAALPAHLCNPKTHRKYYKVFFEIVLTDATRSPLSSMQ